MPDFTREEVIAKIAAGQSSNQADLVGIDLIVARLYKAYLTGPSLTWDDLRDAKYDKNTKFPEDFDPEAAGMVLAE